jgi:hypothetical protein
VSLAQALHAESVEPALVPEIELIERLTIPRLTALYQYFVPGHVNGAVARRGGCMQAPFRKAIYLLYLVMPERHAPNLPIDPRETPLKWSFHLSVPWTATLTEVGHSSKANAIRDK